MGEKGSLLEVEGVVVAELVSESNRGLELTVGGSSILSLSLVRLRFRFVVVVLEEAVDSAWDGNVVETDADLGRIEVAEEIVAVGDISEAETDLPLERVRVDIPP